MANRGTFLDRFQRITSSGNFIPEIDGLRFVAIASVTLFHVGHYLENANKFAYAEPSNWFVPLLSWLSHGWRGVEIFFAISGFVLALPFAKHYLQHSAAVELRSYYIRRITRLEPPYFLVMFACFAMLWLRRDHIPNFSQIVGSFQASLLYAHNLIWPKGTLPLVNPVTWSLEIEVQFYLIAPLIALVFKLSPLPRRLLLILPILIRAGMPVDAGLPHQTLLDYVEFFLVGFLVADLYVKKELDPANLQLWAVIGSILSFIVIWVSPQQFLATPIALFLYCSFKCRFARSLLSNNWITTIGGMCYSIYLIHWMLITTIGGRVVRQYTQIYIVDILIQSTILIAAILILGAAFFLLVERPCMQRDWHRKLYVTAKAALQSRGLLPASRT